MSLLDAHIPQLVASEATFGAKTGLMRSTIAQANIGDAAGSYVAEDAAAASNYTAV